MLLCLEVRRIAAAPSAEGAEQSYRFRFSREEVLIGRSEAVDVQLPDAAVSLVHARLVVKDACWLVVDMGSTNGTSFDGERLDPGQERGLHPGALLRVGPFAIEVLPNCDESGALGGEGLQTAELARQMVRDVLGALDKSDPFFEVLSGPTKGARAAISVAGGIIGRGADCELSLPDKDTTRHHARVRRIGGVVEILDLESKNGVFVGEERIEVPRILQHGDLVRVGSTKLRFVDPAQKLLGELQAPREEESVSGIAQPGARGEEEALVDASIAPKREREKDEQLPSATHASGSEANGLEKLLLFGVGGLLILVALATAIFLLL